SLGRMDHPSSPSESRHSVASVRFPPRRRRRCTTTTPPTGTIATAHQTIALTHAGLSLIDGRTGGVSAEDVAVRPCACPAGRPKRAQTEGNHDDADQFGEGLPMTHAAETSTLDDAHRAIFDAGLAVRKEVLGDEYVDAALSRNAG